MEKNFTPRENLVRNLYGEQRVSESLAMEYQLDSDPVLRSEFNDLKFAKSRLDHAMEKPSATSLRIIMDYSRKTQKEDTHA